jgi:hypothetical protein
MMIHLALIGLVAFAVLGVLARAWNDDDDDGHGGGGGPGSRRRIRVRIDEVNGRGGGRP